MKDILVIGSIGSSVWRQSLYSIYHHSLLSSVIFDGFDEFVDMIESTKGKSNLVCANSSFNKLSDDYQKAIEEIAVVVWVLWKSNLDKIWLLINTWSGENVVLNDACCEILKYGLTKEYININYIRDNIIILLKSSNDEKIEVARGIISIIPVTYLFSITKDLGDEISSNFKAISTIFDYLIAVSPIKCIDLLMIWTNTNKNIVDTIIQDLRLDTMSLNAKNPDLLRNLRKKLVGLQLKIAGSNDNSYRKLARIIRDIDQVRGQLIEAKRHYKEVMKKRVR